MESFTKYQSKILYISYINIFKLVYLIMHVVVVPQKKTNFSKKEEDLDIVGIDGRILLKLFVSGLQFTGFIFLKIGKSENP